jgi:repressor LexA
MGLSPPGLYLLGPDLLGPDLLGPDLLGPYLLGLYLLGPDLLGLLERGLAHDDLLALDAWLGTGVRLYPTRTNVRCQVTASNRCLTRRPATGSIEIARGTPSRRRPVNDTELSGKRRDILDFIATSLRDRGYPPSVREIGEAVGLTSSSTVHTHLGVLQRQGYLVRDPTKPRAIRVRYDANSGAQIERRPARHVPLVGEVAAGTNVLAQQNVEDLLPLPEDFTGDGQLFMLKVRGESMIEAGILDGDYVVARQQPEANTGDIVVAGIPGDEATVKYWSRRGSRVVLTPANSSMESMVFSPDEVQIYGKVVMVLRRL